MTAPEDYEPLVADAVKDFWESRAGQGEKQRLSGKVDAGTRGTVTGGKHLDSLAVLAAKVFLDNGLTIADQTTLPGWYRRNKNWDILAMHRSQLAGIVELKSQVGSIGNNANNRIEEMIGQSVDILKASRENLLGGLPSWFGYAMVIGDSARARSVAKSRGSELDGYPADPVFDGTSYIDRYRIAFERLQAEKELDAGLLIVSSEDGSYWYPTQACSFEAFAAAIQARATIVRARLGGQS
jgi:hypothetical protein